ncbi:YegS/Rv2252/BmrU family lipid kinase [Weissella muntiaci]|uniref:YegS/Rv2252/BmrU family lipid kinase n=2 Tax=Weissella muntiaci TaxID=2508881 RepID=A0A6C2C3Q4_9LACO|nr:YegS/Rv2252/BmrU family lipid kinase [Weissella muntiaci]
MKVSSFFVTNRKVFLPNRDNLATVMLYYYLLITNEGMNMKKLIFLINPAAQSGNAMQIWQKFEAYLKGKQIDYQAQISTRPRDIYNWSYIWQKHNSYNSVLVILGGDGSLNEAVNGQLAANIGWSAPIAYIPAGSGNDFARAYNLSNNLQPEVIIPQLVTAIETEQVQQLDIGRMLDRVNHTRRYFVNNLGVGFDAATVAATNDSTLKNSLNRLHLGKLAYFLSLFGVLRTQDTFNVSLKSDQGQVQFNHGYLLTFSNHPYFGGGVQIMPDANPTDGKMDLIIIEKRNMPQLLHTLFKVLRSEHYGMQQVYRWTSDKYEMVIPRLEYGHVDGEELGVHAFDFEVTSQKHSFYLITTDK